MQFDHPLGRRYLVGFLLPGVVLAFAVMLALTNGRPVDQFDAMTVGRWVGLGVVGLMVGHAFGHPNFRVVTHLSRWLATHWPRLGIYEEKQWIAAVGELAERVRQRIDQMRGGDPPAKEMSLGELFDFCKLMLTERTKVWSAKLEERETEINLLAMNAVPLAVLLIVWAAKSLWLDPSAWFVHGVLPLLALVVPFLLLRNVHPLQAREKQVVFNMFLQHPLLTKMDGPKSDGEAK